MFRILTVFFLMLAPAAQADSSNVIPTPKSVQLKVGQTIVIHAYRGPCGERPGNVDPNRTRKTKLGTLSNGKWGVMKSQSCGGLTPAVEIRFTAQKAGRETIEIQKTKIKVKVK